MKKYVKVLAATAVTAFILEALLFNISSLKTLGNRPVVMAESVTTGADGAFVTPDITAGSYVDNICIEDLDITNAEYAEVTVTLTDEGDEYEYDLPVMRVVPGVKGSGYINIYPYGKVNTIRVRIAVSEGATAVIGKISCNAHKPWVIRPLRLFTTFLVLSILICAFKFRFNIPLKRRDKRQTVCVIALFVLLIALRSLLSHSLYISILPVIVSNLPAFEAALTSTDLKSHP